MTGPTTLVWFRNDLRLQDNPALDAALQRGRRVVPVFIWAPQEEGGWPPGAASRWWLHESLSTLAAQLQGLGSRLILRQGASRDELLAVARQTGATALFWNRRYEPAIIARDSRLKSELRAGGLEAESFNAALLREPWEVANKAGKPFQVFTAYWRTCLTQTDPALPLPAPTTLAPVPSELKSVPLEEFNLKPRIDWAAGLRSAWQPGAAGAAAELARFLYAGFEDYTEARNRPHETGTSRLSPHLHFGEIGPRQIWHALRSVAEERALPARAWRDSQFVAELGWREFAHHLLFHFPHTTERPLRTEFEAFPWKASPKRLRAWQRGQTGVPLVDAGMRELWHTGWMHNRIRMVTASFLVKNLLVPWQEGARWFWDTLVDADLAGNTLGWQWTAGCGADAAPYFRIFNPVSQGQRFDPEGDYVRKWIPELAALPATAIHSPWLASPDVLARAGVKLGKSYPEPIVSLVASREAALAAYATLKRT
jgi:deoxyribodipyrimidine photo-lyase